MAINKIFVGFIAVFLLLCGAAAALDVIEEDAPEINKVVTFIDCGNYRYFVNLHEYYDGYEQEVVFLQALAIFEARHPELTIEGWGPMFFGTDGGADVTSYYVQFRPVSLTANQA